MRNLKFDRLFNTIMEEAKPSKKHIIKENQDMFEVISLDINDDGTIEIPMSYLKQAGLVDVPLIQIGDYSTVIFTSDIDGEETQQAYEEGWKKEGQLIIDSRKPFILNVSKLFKYQPGATINATIAYGEMELRATGRIQKRYSTMY